MGKIFDHFGDPELLLVADDGQNVEIRDAHVDVVSDLGKECSCGCSLSEDFQFLDERVIVHEDRLAFKQGHVVFPAGEDKLSVCELLSEQIHLIFELFHGADEELIHVIEDDDHGFVSKFVEGRVAGGVAEHGDFVEFVSKHVGVFDVEEIDEEVEFEDSTFDEVGG